MTEELAELQDVLAESLPDLALLVHRNGGILARLGGRHLHGSVALSTAASHAAGDALLSEAQGALQHLVRKAIASRDVIESELIVHGHPYEAHISAIGPERAVCVIRACPQPGRPDSLQQTASGRTNLDRRGFLRRFRHSLATAALNERPIAIAALHVDGITDISQALDVVLAEQVVSCVLQRLAESDSNRPLVRPNWYLGQLSESLFVVVLDTPEKELIERCVAAICAAFRQPVQLGDSEFHLHPYAGVAVLGQDATTPKTLMQHARAAALEAQRATSERVHFFSDTLQLRTLSRLDAAQELRDAIENSQLGLRYASRHDLRTGNLTALVSYVHWKDPIRGIIAPAEFLRIAEATGSARALSRSLVELLQRDFVQLEPTLDPGVRVSFGPLRHHLLADDFIADVQALLARGLIAPDRLELRISERTYVARPVAFWNELARAGIQLVVDEFGREVSSLDLLARGPIWGIQLDRAWVASCEADPVARRVCRGVIKLTAGLGLTPLAAGVDTATTRAMLARVGCKQGHGDLFEPVHALAKAAG